MLHGTLNLQHGEFVLTKTRFVQRLTTVGAIGLVAGLVAVVPAEASAHNCTEGGSNCIEVDGSGLKVTAIEATYSPAPETHHNALIAKIRIHVPGHSAATHWAKESSRQDSPAVHNWNAYAKKYPNGTQICTGWKWTSALACATVHN